QEEAEETEDGGNGFLSLHYLCFLLLNPYFVPTGGHGRPRSKVSFDIHLEAAKFPGFMKSNPLRTALEWVLIMSLLLSLWFFIRFFNQSRQARALQPQLQ